MRQVIRRAMEQPDDLVISLDYTDSKGNVSRRVVSPVRFLASNRFLALCLCREEPRQFHLASCRNVRLGRACDVVMPVPLITLSGDRRCATGTA